MSDLPWLRIRCSDNHKTKLVARVQLEEYPYDPAVDSEGPSTAIAVLYADSSRRTDAARIFVHGERRSLIENAAVRDLELMDTPGSTWTFECPVCHAIVRIKGEKLKRFVEALATRGQEFEINWLVSAITR